ncbi:MAG: hypothetical protein ABR970_02935 [Roseiarcus sp.]|jgi:hypothetical protein
MSAPATVTLKRGSLYLSRDVADRYLAGLEAIVLLRRGDDLAILPVRHAAAGGSFLKRRNSAGDRVVHAPEFFRAHDVGDDIERELAVSWSREAAGLVATGAFASQR